MIWQTCPLSHGNFDGIFVGFSGTSQLKATHSASYKQDFRLFWLTTSLKSVQWKLNRRCWPTCSPFSAYGIFCAFQTQVTRQLIGRSGPIWTPEIFWCLRAINSDHIWSQFELVRGLIPILVSCKFDEGPVKHELRRFSIIRLRENFRRSRASNF